MTDNIDISKIDFDRYRSELKLFLQNQSQFKDYDYEGSNMAVLLDVLAYNTFQNVFYDNMSISEMFLDSARLRSSVASHAKSLNYTPRSRVSSAAKISVTLNVSDNVPFVTIPKRTRFVSPNSNGKLYSFYTHETLTILPVGNLYKSDPIDIYEGILAEEQYFALADFNSFYKITNKFIDTNTLRVYVTNKDGVEEEYTLAESLYGLNESSKVYYIQLTDDNYEIYFGRNKFGIQPSVNDIIKLEYLISSGANANGVKVFSAQSTISGYAVSSIITDGPSSGGSGIENINSIKFYAPKSLQVQERAVTELDYEILLKNKFPEIQSVSVVGGEKVEPPQYGKVIVFVDTVNAMGISENTKFKIKKYLDQRTPLAIDSVIMSPDFFFLELVSNITFDNKNSLKTFSDILQSSKKAIMNFNEDNLNKFNAKLAYSKLVGAIDDSDEDIISNQTNMRLFCERNVIVGSKNNFIIRFENELTPISDYALRGLQSQVPNHPIIPNLTSDRADRLPTISTSIFIYNGSRVYIRDNGFGVLQIVRNAENRDIILNKNVGSVDYKKGIVKFVNFIPSDINGVFSVYANTKLKDINAPNGSILSLREKDLKIKVETVRGN